VSPRAAGAEEVAAEDEAAGADADADEAAEEAGGAEDDPPDEHPATAATTAPAATAPPSLSIHEVEPGMTHNPLLVTGRPAYARTPSVRLSGRPRIP
jgi:hypothetical protein